MFWTPWVHIQTDLRRRLALCQNCDKCCYLLPAHLFQSVLLASVKEHWEKNVEFWNHLSDRKRHMEMLFLLVWKIPGTYQLGWDSENPFLTAPPELSRSIINYSRRCTQEMWGSACLLSSFPHDLSNIRHFNSSDSTVINVLISIFPPRCLCCLSYALIIN